MHVETSPEVAGEEVASSIPLVSVVLPCYKQSEQALDSTRRIQETLERTIGRNWEIVVVDDGGGGFEAIAPEDSRVKILISGKNRGKGAALRKGLLKARGHSRIFTDADLPFAPLLIPVMHGYLQEGEFHLVAGDRTLRESVYHESTSTVRRLLSSAATFMIGTLVTGGVFDTQCGLKGIRGDIADLLLPLTRINRFAFDVELMYLALRFNCNVLRIPVEMRESSTSSTVRPLADSVGAARDILRIKQRAMSGQYESAALRQIIGAPFRRRVADTEDAIGRSDG
ncbi:MAG: glycosyltransferase [Gemmatimonadota bacterium]|nr:glycosyltransferase [Gemmatimonadota bacterium]